MGTTPLNYRYFHLFVRVVPLTTGKMIPDLTRPMGSSDFKYNFPIIYKYLNIVVIQRIIQSLSTST